MKPSLPPVLAVAGTDDHRRRLFVKDMVRKWTAGGGYVLDHTGDDREALEGVIGSVGVLLTTPTLVLVSEPEKLPAGLLDDHRKSPAPELSFVLLYETEKPTDPVWSSLPKEVTRTFTAPPSYKLDDHAADYAVTRARALGYHLSAPLSRALVRRAGNDLGVVHYEVEKVTLLARARSAPVELTADLLKATLAPLTELDGQLIVEAIGVGDRAATSAELDRYYQSKKGDPTVELCGRTLSPTFVRWLTAAHLDSAGMSPTVAAGRVGTHPWYWEHKVLPGARRWRVGGIAALLKVVARAQTATFQGAVSPWNLLVSGLLGAFTVPTQ